MDMTIKDKPTTTPICPFCKKKLSGSGGCFGNGIMMKPTALYYTCFECNYHIEDIQYTEIESAIQQDVHRVLRSAHKLMSDAFDEFVNERKPK